MKIQIDWAGASRRDIQMTVLTEEGALEWTIGLLQSPSPRFDTPVLVGRSTITDVLGYHPGLQYDCIG